MAEADEQDLVAGHQDPARDNVGAEEQEPHREAGPSRGRFLHYLSYPFQGDPGARLVELASAARWDTAMLHVPNYDPTSFRAWNKDVIANTAMAARADEQTWRQYSALTEACKQLDGIQAKQFLATAMSGLWWGAIRLQPL